MADDTPHDSTDWMGLAPLTLSQDMTVPRLLYGVSEYVQAAVKLAQLDM
jgi:hypothetical protein